MTRGGKRKGAGPKFKYGEKMITIKQQLPVSLFRVVEQYAKKNNLSRNEAIVRLLFRAFE